MKTYYVMSPTGEILKLTAAKHKLRSQRIFLKMPYEKLSEVNKNWTPYKRQGYKIAEQLGLPLFDKAKEVE